MDEVLELHWIPLLSKYLNISLLESIFIPYQIAFWMCTALMMENAMRVTMFAGLLGWTWPRTCSVLMIAGVSRTQRMKLLMHPFINVERTRIEDCLPRILHIEVAFDSTSWCSRWSMPLYLDFKQKHLNQHECQSRIGTEVCRKVALLEQAWLTFLNFVHDVIYCIHDTCHRYKTYSPLLFHQFLDFWLWHPTTGCLCSLGPDSLDKTRNIFPWMDTV